MRPDRQRRLRRGHFSITPKWYSSSISGRTRSQMPEYKVYVQRDDGHVISQVDLSCDGVEQAKEWTKALVDDKPVELWKGLIRIERFEPTHCGPASASRPHSGRLECGRTSAPRLPHASQTNLGSISEPLRKRSRRDFSLAPENNGSQTQSDRREVDAISQQLRSGRC
jgi:hypothetical protein